MKRIIINTVHQTSEILTGGSWTDFVKYFQGRDAVIITDDNILRIYGKDFPGIPVLSIAPGEKSKNLEIINDLAGKLLDIGIDRKGLIIGIGGGVVCDIAGFLASVYMRGIDFGFVSTSLLSQVDASVGGKNGVNVGSVKNIIGNFNQPHFVICDPLVLKTLPDDEYLSGLAELIKNAVIIDTGLFGLIGKNIEPILRRKPKLLTDLITRSVELKANVVQEDEKESGIRMLLNFGHTFGHAIEAKTGMKHGFAVAAGMIIAADISVEMGILHLEERNILFNLLKSFNLVKSFSIPFEQMKNLILQDKKKSGENVNFVLLEKKGKAIVQSIPVTKLLDYYHLIITRQ